MILWLSVAAAQSLATDFLSLDCDPSTLERHVSPAVSARVTVHLTWADTPVNVADQLREALQVEVTEAAEGLDVVLDPQQLPALHRLTFDVEGEPVRLSALFHWETAPVATGDLVLANPTAMRASFWVDDHPIGTVPPFGEGRLRGLDAGSYSVKRVLPTGYEQAFELATIGATGGD